MSLRPAEHPAEERASASGPSPEKVAWSDELIRFVAHLRLPFQAMLAPIFLWGALAEGSAPDGILLLGFLLFHVSLCAGATAYNSYYDRDEGPIAWLKSPPPVSRTLLHGSLGLQAVGLILAFLVSVPFCLLFLVLILVGMAYSHPSIRIKRHLWSSMVTVALAQGCGAFLAGFLSSGGSFGAAFDAGNALAWGAAVVIPTGLYPLTQIYQIEEDRARGDQTFAVRYGAGVAFTISTTALTVGAVCAAVVLAIRFHPVDGVLVLIGTGVVLGLVHRWRRRFHRQDERANHDEMLRATGLVSLAFSGLILFRLFFPDVAYAAVSTPVSTPASMPVSMPASMPVSTPVSTPVATPVSMPVSTPVSAPGLDVRAITFVAAALAPSPASASDAAPRMNVQVDDAGDGAVEISAWIHLEDTDPRSAWNVVADYEALPDYMPNVEESRVLERSDSLVVVHQRAKVTFVVTKHLDTVLEFRPTPPRRLEFEQRRGDLDRFQGAWQVSAMPGGVVSVYFHAILDPNIGVPGWIVRTAIDHAFSRMMPSLADEVRRRAPGSG